MKRAKLVYAETYRAPGLQLRPEERPDMPSAPNFMVADAFVLKAGIEEIGGVRYEFQILKVRLIPRSP